MTPPPTERRRSSIAVEDYYSPGILRAESIAERKLKEHDNLFRNLDSSRWQTMYSLLEHSRKLSRVVSKVSAARYGKPRLVRLNQSAGLLHDIGKVNEFCHEYRLARPLSPEELKRVRMHPTFSGDEVINLARHARRVDREYFQSLYPLVRYHDEPWQIADPELRPAGIDLYLSDIFIAMMETRDRPGLSQFEAVDALEEIIIRKVSHPAVAPYEDEIRESFSAIKRLYGRDGLATPE